MIGKPFKPPLLARQPQSQSEPQSDLPPAKKRRISQEEINEVKKAVEPSIIASQAARGFRKPLLDVVNGPCSSTIPNLGDHQAEAYYSVLW